MSIDANIVGVTRLPDGTARLTLEQPDRSRVAGQQTMIVENPPDGIENLVGEHVWGGDGYILIGDTTVADRIGYTRLRWKSKPKG